jgi:transposase-like protein
MRTAHRSRRSIPPRSAFAGFRFPSDVIVLAIRWYLRFGLSYRDLEELLTERGVEVDHVTIYRWVLRFTPPLADAARPCRHRVGDRWSVDETYVKVAGGGAMSAGRSTSSGRSSTSSSPRRDTAAARQFLEQAIAATKVTPIEVTTDRAAAYPAVLDDLLPATRHRTAQYAKQPHRMRPRSAEGAATADARAQTGPQCHRRAGRPCLGAEPSARPLRARGRGTGDPAVAFDELTLAI